MTTASPICCLRHAESDGVSMFIPHPKYSAIFMLPEGEKCVITPLRVVSRAARHDASSGTASRWLKIRQEEAVRCLLSGERVAGVLR
jgi:hypothetical protein